MEEKPTHQSSSRVAVAACSRNAPATFGAHTRCMPSRVSSCHQAFTGHTGGMHDAAQWPSRLFGSRHQPLRYSGKAISPDTKTISVLSASSSRALR